MNMTDLCLLESLRKTLNSINNRWFDIDDKNNLWFNGIPLNEIDSVLSEEFEIDDIITELNKAIEPIINKLKTKYTEAIKKQLDIMIEEINKK